MTMMLMLIIVVMKALTVEKANVERKVVTEVVIKVVMAVVVKVAMAVAMKAVTAVVVKVVMAVVTIAVTKVVMTIMITHHRPRVCRCQLVLLFQVQQVNLLVPHNQPASVHQLPQVCL